MASTSAIPSLRGGLPGGLEKLQAPVWNYRVKNRYPHDSSAFTQGLLVGPDGFLYESTGLNGRSEVRQVEIETGAVKQRKKLDDKLFGEGLGLLGDRLVQLTWKNEEALVYGLKTMAAGPTWHYQGEGWGLTSHDARWLMSNGSETLSWRDSKDFHELAQLKVSDGEHPVPWLNELEWVDQQGGEVWANVWQSDYLAVIEPKSGKVKGWVDLRGLLSPRQAQAADVLNGIAYDAAHKRLFVTGKLWPTLFEIEVQR